jgi:NADPH:quinone reductase-like Zn-dependent oxidoreductase
MMQKRHTITGSTLRARTPEEKGRIARELEARVWPLLESRRVTPRIDAEFPLADARLAHERLESRANIGKIVLRVADL